MNPKFARLPSIVVALGLVVFCLAVFYPSLHNGYVWDDEIFLVRSSAYAGTSRLAASLFEPFALYAAYYRPLVAFSYALIPATSDYSASAHHAINLVMHIANVLLVYVCVIAISRRIFTAPENQRGHFVSAVVAALVFAVHPTVLEPLLWISGRFDMALTLFSLLFVWVDVRRRITILSTLLLAIIYFCAAASKEAAAVLPFAVVLIHTFLWTYERDSGGWATFMWRRRSGYVAMIVAGLVYLLLRTYAMDHAPPNSGLLATSASNWWDRILLAALSLLEYGRLVFFPWTTTAPVHPYDFNEIGAVGRIGIPVAVGLAVATLLVLIVTKRARWPYPVLIFIAMISPVLHLVNFSAATSLIADRYALAPFALSLTLATPLCASYFCRSAISRMFAITLGLVALLIIISWIAIARVTTLVWRDDVSLWAYAYARAPQAEMASSNYVSSLLKAGKFDEAEIIATKIREQGKTSMASLTNFALIRAVRGDFEAAYGILRAVDVHKTTGLTAKDLSTYYCTFAQIDKLTSNWSAALEHSNESLRYDSQLVICKLVRATALYYTGSKAEALAMLFELKPTVAPALQHEIEQLLKLWQTTN